MTNLAAETVDRPRAVRRRDAEATRRAILAAAKLHFARSGYEGAFLRDIAVEAGVDAALINRYFGSKEGLFAEVLKRAIRSDKLSLFEADRNQVGRELAQTFATQSAHHNEDRLHAFQFLLRAATSPTTAPMLNDAVQQRFMGPIREWLGGDDAPARARLISAFFIGLLVERLIRDEPLPDNERQPFIERLAPILQALVDESFESSNKTSERRTP
jgi:AcrR family transcriptional regulator